MWFFTCQDHEQCLSLMRLDTWEADERTVIMSEHRPWLSHYRHDSRQGQETEFHFKKKRAKIHWSVYSSAAGDWAVSFRSIEVFVFFFPSSVADQGFDLHSVSDLQTDSHDLHTPTRRLKPLWSKMHDVRTYELVLRTRRHFRFCSNGERSLQVTKTSTILSSF